MTKIHITDVTEDAIKFSGEHSITFYHEPDCCEWNYADFQQLEPMALRTTFDADTMEFEAVEEAGFRFRSANTHWFFIPCYSDQNGYYSSDVDIYWNGTRVLNVEGEML